MRRIATLAGCVVFIAASVSAQTPAPGPTFEVVSIKPSAPLTELAKLQADIQSGRLRMGINVLGSRVEMKFVTLAELIRRAYDVKPYQVIGPDWMQGTRFDITATMPKGATNEQVNPMIRAMLEERFKLQIHREKKELPVYALIVGKDGPKLKPSAPDVDAPKSEAAPQTGILVNGQSVTVSKDGRGATMTGGPAGPAKISIGPAGEHIEAQKITLQAFADVITPLVDRPVVDMTGLTGTYQITLDIAMEDLMAMAMKAAAAAGISLPVPPPGAPGPGGLPVAPDPTGGSMFKTIEQLGLKLDARKAPVDVIVIDRVEKTPTED